jgi:hypothetical protein
MRADISLCPFVATADLAAVYRSLVSRGTGRAPANRKRYLNRESDRRGDQDPHPEYPGWSKQGGKRRKVLSDYNTQLVETRAALEIWIRSRSRSRMSA